MKEGTYELTIILLCLYTDDFVINFCRFNTIANAAC